MISHFTSDINGINASIGQRRQTIVTKFLVRSENVRRVKKWMGNNKTPTTWCGFKCSVIDGQRMKSMSSKYITLQVKIISSSICRED